VSSRLDDRADRLDAAFPSGCKQFVARTHSTELDCGSFFGANEPRRILLVEEIPDADAKGGADPEQRPNRWSREVALDLGQESSVEPGRGGDLIDRQLTPFPRLAQPRADADLRLVAAGIFVP
jgi:hypothetical protein